MNSIKNTRENFPSVAADCVIEKDGKLLLVTRGIEPFKGKLALPGGVMDPPETIEQTAIREMKEETNLDIRLTDILGIYSAKDRDPRYAMVITFIGEIIGGEERAGDDAAEVHWINPATLKPENVAFDHYQNIQHYLQWKKTKGTFWSTKA